MPDARRDPPAAPDLSEPDRQPPGGTDTSSLAKLGGGLGSAMQGAALATALTVAGTVGVIGTLSLAPDAQVRLSQEDRALLRESLTLTANTTANTTANELKISMQRFETLVAHFESTQLGMPADELQAIVTALARLELAINVLAKKPPAEVDTKIVADAILRSGATTSQALATQLADIRKAIALLPSTSGTDMRPVVNELHIVNKSLDELRSTAENASPRRNIRGVSP